MAEISLADLIKAKTESTPEAATVEPQEVIAAITDQVEEISPEERAKIDSIKEKINLMDSNTALQYGVGAQKNIAEFSDSILNNVRTKDSGYVGELLGDLVTRIKGFDADGSRDSFWKKLPIIGSGVHKVEKMMSSYEKLSVQVDRIQSDLSKAKAAMMKDVAMFDKLFAQNLEYFKLLQLYIKAGEEKIGELRQSTLPKLRQEAAASQNPMAVQAVSDFENTIDRFEKKIYDLKISKTLAIQTAPQVRLIQNNDKVLIDRIQSAIYNTIPLWKNQMVIALGLARQQNVLQTQRAVNDMTNDLLKKNAEMLKQNSLETAKENERGIVDIETVRKVNDDLIATIEGTLKIQQEGRQRRQSAEQELRQIEEKLKQTLLIAAKLEG